MNGARTVEADLTYVSERFETGVQVEILDDGTIGRVGRLGVEDAERLEGCALLPGMINAHSHAFQRGLRGQAERYPKKAGTFWSWRKEMYDLAEHLSTCDFHDTCRRCFVEMLRAGITTVGEFHYFHHDESCAGNGLDEVVLSAARKAGIRMVLLNACYLTGDIDQPLERAQRRFGTESVEAYLAQVERIGGILDGPTQSQGLVAHSIRAVSIDDIVRIHQRARAGDLPFHMHVEEQNREIDTCLLKYKARPMELLLERLSLGDEFTAVHCTHTQKDDMTRFIDAGGNVCICPTTEGNLADGVPAIARMWTEGAHVCLGSDSNVRIDFNEEMRWLEYVQRLRYERRGVCQTGEGDVAAGLFRAATSYGARSLKVNAGTISTGKWADFIAIDLNHVQLHGWSSETLLAAFVFGCDGRVVNGTCVGGKWIDGLN